MDTALLDRLKVMAKREKKAKSFMHRLRVKGEIIGLSMTKNGNIKMIVARDDTNYNFIVLKTHKERFDLVNTLKKGSFVYGEGIRHLRMVICTKLKQLEHIDFSRQAVIA